MVFGRGRFYFEFQGNDRVDEVVRKLSVYFCLEESYESVPESRRYFYNMWRIYNMYRLQQIVRDRREIYYIYSAAH